MPFISIFIPAYKNEKFLARLLESIVYQTYTDYEVIVTDDSPNDAVERSFKLIADKKENWFYYKNRQALGMPQNWNKGLELCKGSWIKIMHDDDWFLDDKSLFQFANHAKYTSVTFLFSSYKNIFNTGREDTIKLTNFRKRNLQQQPLTLLSKNVIGPPSVCMVHRSIKELYDERLKWRVDIDYYIRILRLNKGFDYIDQPLVNVGINNDQVTNEVKYNAEIEIPEANILLQKYGVSSLKNIIVYDSWWRFVRNLNITSSEEIKKYSNNNTWPNIIKLIIKDLNILSPIIQKIGIISKLFMLFSYLKNYSKIDA